ncbi:Peptidase_S8 domain-containing protein [Rubrivivax sp. A210]|uniref:S8 family serine peptidase n=1 Tax=Rubrivivax sp. A210 TaxID=2772301 RepID=UPI00191B07C4|nr:S8 family serine peptidase [Rubrivivax sp. A210]CAD5374302.1 Peptidase_S8 domain-containing protein [Rubrivivax sp. A210]
MNQMPQFLRRCSGAALVSLVALLGAGSVSAHAQVASKFDQAVASEVLVKLRSTADLQPLLARFPLTLASQFGARPIYRLKVIGAAAVNDVLAGLALEPGVMLAEANASHASPEARRNVPWAIGTATDYVEQWAPQSMRLAQAQTLSNGAGIRVAVLDTGIDASHPMLAGRLLPGFDFVDFDTDPAEVPGGASYGHGTHVAGLIAMAAPGASIVPMRVLDADGVGNAWVLAEALLRAVDPDGNPATDDGAQVINLSLGSLNRTKLLGTIQLIATCGDPVLGDPVADLSDPGYADDRARCAAASTGTVVVVAAGNDGSRSIKQYPAAESVYGVIPVGATGSNGFMAGFSNYGSWIDVAAPGGGITSLAAGGGYATWSGTSMAAPLVAGTVALLRAREPGLTPRAVAERIRKSGATVCGRVSQVQVNAMAALTDRLPAPLNCSLTQTSGFTSSSRLR